MNIKQTKPHEEIDRKLVLDRASRIQGQMEGVRKMIEGGRYCPDILNTISAIHVALRGLVAALLEDHVGHCVRDAAKSKGDDMDAKLQELVDLYKRRFF